MKGEIILSPIKSFIDWVLSPFTFWARRNSIYPLHVGLMCCAIEMGATMACRWDTERLGVLARASPRQCDLLIVTGPISKKMAPRLKLLYDQMPDPKWVLVMGECAISGGPFADSYSVIKGTKEILPVDVYIPGCPPRPEALIRGLQEIQAVIRHGKRKRAKIAVDYFKELELALIESSKEEVKIED